MKQFLGKVKNRLQDTLQLFGPKVRHISYFGIKIFYNRGNTLLNRLRAEPVFEEMLSAAIVKDLKKKQSPIFVDVGVNIGLISAYVIANVPNVKIFAFEPGPTQSANLRQTIKLNNLESKISLIDEALGNQVGKVEFFSHDNKYQAFDGFKDTERRPGAKSIPVNSNTLDNWWRNNNRPDIGVIKIDTEGSELWVLEGAKQVLLSCRPTVYLEIDPRNLKPYTYSKADIIEFLEDQNYLLTPLSGEDTFVATWNS